MGVGGTDPIIKRRRISIRLGTYTVGQREQSDDKSNKTVQYTFHKYKIECSPKVVNNRIFVGQTANLSAISKVTSMDRKNILQQWLSGALKTTTFSCTPLTNDASFRRYYRIQTHNTQYVLMDAPPPEAPQLFADIAGILAKAGLEVPRVFAANFAHGFLLLSDLGDRLYLPALNVSSADGLYQQAMQALIQIQPITAKLPTFTRDFLQAQLNIFEEWYLIRHRAVKALEPMRETLAPIYELLFTAIECQPQVFVHRDYHSRNLMILDERSPGILDFQDAMIGPITYDLVSLLQDCYISWPREKIIQWVADFQARAVVAELLSSTITENEFLRWFDWTGLHRHLKNLGIFARLHYRDNKPQYLNDMPQIYQYIFETSSRYEALEPLKDFFQTLQARGA